MHRLAVALLVALVLAGLAFVAATVGALPDRVATHFARGGLADGWMPRAGYTAFMLLLTALLPLGLFVGVGVLPGRHDRFAKLPHRDIWLSPTHRAATLAWLRGFGAAMGILGALVAIGVHAAILDAHARTPPRLDEPVFIAGLVAFVVAVLGGVVLMHVTFRNVPRRR